MKWQEGLAIAGALTGGSIGKAAQIPLAAKQKRDRNKAIEKSKGYYDFFSNDNDGPV